MCTFLSSYLGAVVLPGIGFQYHGGQFDCNRCMYIREATFVNIKVILPVIQWGKFCLIAYWVFSWTTMPLSMPPSYCITAFNRNTIGIIMQHEDYKFWETKSLKEMTKSEWESLCDHCGRCCLHRVRDGKTGKTKLLAVACQHLDPFSCCCSIYEERFKVEPTCLELSPDKIRRLKRLPYTCAYRCIVEGRKLEWWHPLVSGDHNTVHEAGISVQGKVVTGENVNLDQLDYYTVVK